MLPNVLLRGPRFFFRSKAARAPDVTDDAACMCAEVAAEEEDRPLGEGRPDCAREREGLLRAVAFSTFSLSSLPSSENVFWQLVLGRWRARGGEGTSLTSSVIGVAAAGVASTSALAYVSERGLAASASGAIPAQLAGGSGDDRAAFDFVRFRPLPLSSAARAPPRFTTLRCAFGSCAASTNVSGFRSPSSSATESAIKVFYE